MRLNYSTIGKYIVSYVGLLIIIISFYELTYPSSDILIFILLAIITVPLTWVGLLPLQSDTIWMKRLILYFILSLISILLASAFSLYLGSVETDIDSARYMLSALIQSEAAIIAIVITLTLVAVQHTSSTYSTRIIDIFKTRNPDFWILFFIYLFSMIYSLSVLKIIKDGHIIESQIFRAYFLSMFAFISLIPYMWNTIGLLKPTRIILILSEKITKKNLLNYVNDENRKLENDPFLPIIDIVTRSLINYDYSTAREGLIKLFELTIKIEKQDHLGNKDFKEIVEIFIGHFITIVKLAINKSDKICIFIVLSWLYETLTIFVEKDMEYKATDIVGLVGDIGKLSIEKKINGPQVHSIRVLEKIGNLSFEKNMKILQRSVTISLADIAETSVNNKMRYLTSEVMFVYFDIISKAFKEQPEKQPEEDFEEEYENKYEKELYEKLDDKPLDLPMLVVDSILLIFKISVGKKMDDEINEIRIFIGVINQMAKDFNRNDIVLKIANEQGLTEFQAGFLKFQNT